MPVESEKAYSPAVGCTSVDVSTIYPMMINVKTGRYCLGRAINDATVMSLRSGLLPKPV